MKSWTKLWRLVPLTAIMVTSVSNAATVNLAKVGVYTLSATVGSASSATGCPYGVNSSTANMAGYTVFTGFKTKGNTIAMSGQTWVLGISPTAAGLTKFGYALNFNGAVINGSTVKFTGSAKFGGPAAEFSDNAGTYSLVINPTTLASTLTVTSPQCIITYSMTFTRSIPAKFLNLL